MKEDFNTFPTLIDDECQRQLRKVTEMCRTKYQAELQGTAKTMDGQSTPLRREERECCNVKVSCSSAHLLGFRGFKGKDGR
jgi:hypothetical protein